MSSPAIDSIDATGTTVSGSADDPAYLTTATRVSKYLVWIALAAVIAAFAINWWAASSSPSAVPVAGSGSSAGEGGAAPEVVALEKPAIEMIPENVLQYETITRQAVPGMGDAGAEAVYKTLNMNLEAQIPVVVYTRVEGFTSQDEAQARVEELMGPYTVSRVSTTLGPTPAIAGYTQDKGAYAFGWVRGRYATYVKGSFAEWIPAHSFEIVERQAVDVAELVEFYQRTGKQGVQAR